MTATCFPSVPQRHLAAATLASLTFAAGCGDRGSSMPTPKQTATPTPRSAIDVSQSRAIKPGMSEGQIVQQFGPPSGPLRPDGPGRRCGFYDVAGQDPARLQWRVCFTKHKVSLFSTFYRQPAAGGTSGAAGPTGP